MAIDLTWNTLEPYETQYIKFSENDFYYNPKNYIEWVIKNKDTIPHWNEFSDASKQEYDKVLNLCKQYLDTYLKQIEQLPHIGIVKNAIVMMYALYSPIEGNFDFTIRILPSKYINFDSNFYLVRKNIYQNSNPSLYSGIYATFGYTYASSTDDIELFIPIKNEYKENEYLFKDAYYAQGHFVFDSNNDDFIAVGNFEEQIISDVSYGDKCNLWNFNTKGYAAGNIQNLRMLNLCTASGGGDIDIDIDFDGTTHENDIKKPSRKNISSTPNLPTYYNLSGISGYNLYQIPVEQLDECVSYLNSGVVVSTSSGFLTWIKLLARIVQYAFLDWINNRNDYIISWKMVYYIPTINANLDPTINVGATSGIQIANHHITQQYDTIDCGNISIDASSFTDYEPYTYYEIYLPFVGTVSLRADTIAGRTLNVKYVVDNVSGESTCIISTIDSDVEQIIHTYECNLSIDIPYKSFDYLGNIRRNASALVSAVASGAVALATKSIPNSSSSEAGYEPPQCIRSNVGSSLLSSMLPRIPYLIIRRVPMYNVNDSNRVYGKPTLEYATLDTYSGFMVKVRQVRLDGLTCTDEEKNMIQSILESGVIINE